MLLSSERCYLREWTVQDADFIFELNSDSRVLKYTGDEPLVSVKAAQEFIKSYSHYEEFGYGRWLVCKKETNEPIGWCGFRNHDGMVDLGFRFQKDFWGQGYASETAMACLYHVFQLIQLEEVIARAAVENSASIRVIEKLGMIFWKEDLCHGQQANYYRITRDEFLENSEPSDTF